MPDLHPPHGQYPASKTHATDVEEWAYDWERHEQPEPSIPPNPVALNDETLRDGLQSASVRMPSIEEKLELLHCMVSLGIDRVNIGMPIAGRRLEADAVDLAREVVTAGLPLDTGCAARTLRSDIDAVAEVVERSGLAVVADCFIGSSPIRQLTEGWHLDHLLQCTYDAVTYARNLGLEVMFVTEDTTRARPEHVARLYLEAVRAGASAVCVADTVGAATPDGTAALVRFLGDVLADKGCSVPIDWHGHDDRGLSVANSLAAARAGAQRIHGTALGIGERVGNTPMDQLLINFHLLGLGERDLGDLAHYCRLVSTVTGTEIPRGYPAVGDDAFRTATGVHASALLKARRRGDEGLEDKVYSAVPASLVGRQQKVDIGPNSGLANVYYWLESRGLRVEKEIAEAVLEHAKITSKVLQHEEIHQILGLPAGED